MDWNAGLYDSRHGFVSAYGQSVVTLLAPQPGEAILDVGCGTGDLAREIADAGATVVGIDASPSMIEAARKNYPGIDFRVEDAAALPFDATFDAVFSNAALHWVRDANAAARGIARALVRGGRFVAEMGGAGNVARMESALREAASRIAAVRYESPWYFPSVGEYASVLESAGLEVRAAWLIDRPTALEGADGVKTWYRMFLPWFIDAIPEAAREQVLSSAEAAVADLRRDGVWYADYRRLRLVAVKA